ncbi:hypothetical protein [Microbacterium thalli]|uniref:hypothetical protein n=1 Tax=Microbacterium thalli TaxID=3027921 RepID=UPI00236696F0|nr:hypothetical protein [Microbacterium thalli]MDD7930077.1 hypothetical protein [Microbacterium thalli]
MKRNAFGQLISQPPFLRFADEGGDGGGGDGGSGGDGGARTFTQEDVDRIVADRTARAERNARADERQKIENAAKGPKDGAGDGKPADGGGEGKPAGVSADDVQQRIDDALAAERKELALERVTDQLEKALDGRNYPASKLFALDRSQFIGADGKTVDTEKLQKWVDDNSEEGAAPSRRLRAQGTRDANATGGSVSAGRDLFASEKTPKKKD